MSQNHLSNRVRSLSESATLAMTRRGRELKEAGKDVISLSIGEPDFNTPTCIKEAAIEAIQNNITHYSPVAGYKELREAIAAKFQKENNLTYRPGQVIVSGGAKQSIANAILCLINPGDEVLIPAPYWVSYPEMVKMAEGVPVIIPSTLTTDFKVDPQAVREKMTDRTRLFVFSSPCNPSGTIFSREELRALAEVLAEKEDLYVISDEIYEEINFGGKHESMAQFDFIKDRVITVNGVSKGFAMTGWRIGYAGAPQHIADAMNTLQGQYTSGPSSISQMAALVALREGACALDEVSNMKKAFHERRDLVLELLKKIPGVKTNIPEGAFYVFPDVSSYYGKTDGTHTIKNGMDLCMYLLDTVYVSLVPGEAFGCDDCIRISYATKTSEIERAFERIATALAKLH
ncbi:MAG: pyridoxal phosphate-dependent aminotransferase [Bacteroidales bacterium]|nr:pyridoxal phosphate-dependent aminotransferase [Bacteroidales bacterium]MDD4177641.1 pyridoxal phosphate-dependent aminotransferase [Bacteroidales bacterium]MDY0336091.1 pyridoxal phosphate-dependent aminotransferase [Bacteroidales bacterium]